SSKSSRPIPAPPRISSISARRPAASLSSRAKRPAAFCASASKSRLSEEAAMAALITMPRLMSVGGGALAELPALMARLGLKHPLVVTDPYIARSGILDRATALLDKAQLPWSVFSDTVSDPTTDVIDIGVAILRDGGFDSLVAIGGGSSIDTAKGMSVLFANGGHMRDYKVPAEIPQLGPPIIAIPTTAGTGSEVTRFTVVTDTETDEKMLIAGLACCPAAAIVDFELTLTMPLRLTADTGIYSLTHAIEAYVSRRANPVTDVSAKNGMGLVGRAMGVAEEGEGSQAAVARLVGELRRLNEDLKVPTPRAYGIERSRYDELLPLMASQALASGSPANNPRVPSADEIIDLYRRVYE